MSRLKAARRPRAFVTLTLHPAIDRVVELARLTPGATESVSLRLAVPAGKGVNTARGLRRLVKGAVSACIWCGAGEADFHTAMLAEECIATQIIARPVLTRSCITILEASGRETHLKESMPAPSPKEEAALTKALAKLKLRGACVAICGSAPPETRAKTMARVFARLRAADVLLADTNGPMLDAAGRAGLEGTKGNAAEIGAWLRLKRAFDPASKADRAKLRAACRATGTSLYKGRAGSAPRAVVVTLGARGACLARADGFWVASSPPLYKGRAVSATGCGDAATAGWLWAFEQFGIRVSPEEQLRCVVACGTAKLASADPGGLDGELARGLAKRTKVRRVE